jgi:rubrerythrin
MTNYSIQEVVEQAIQTEKLGYEFYNTLAEKFTDDNTLKGVFEFLAGQELKHERMFSTLKEQMSTDDLVNWDEASNYMRAIVESEFFLGSKNAMPSLDHVNTTKEALRQAMFFEKETLLYFYSMRDLVHEWGIVDEIIKEEKSHIKKLAELMD